MREILIKPGYIYVTFEPRILHSIVGSGTVIAMYDKERQVGGMNYFLRPSKNYFKDCTPYYSTPAIVGLVNLFTGSGSEIDHLEAHIFGGGENPDANGFEPGLGESNIQKGLELLKYKNIAISGMDIGSKSGRTIFFNTKTGELVIGKLKNIDNYYWYPPLIDEQ